MTSLTHLPLFQDLTVLQIALALGYSPKYVRAVKYGGKPLTERFQVTCALGLRRSRRELFGEEK